LISTNRLLGHERHPVLADGDFGQAFDDCSLSAVDPALNFGLRSAADDDHVVVLTRGHQRRFEARGEHQHRREDIHHQRHAARGQKGGQPPGGEIAHDVEKGNSHGHKC
jgi:hypothetical protein